MALISCPECGAQISDAAVACPYCGISLKPTAQSGPASVAQTQAPRTVPPQDAPKPPCPETHLTKAIIFTCICCWPLGIPAIVNAAGVSTAYIQGQYALAEEKSANAKKWCNICLIVGIVFWVCYIVFIIVAVALGVWAESFGK